ncbi:hypothetical protein Mal15_08930 [Stieleria maiorica]|uniref:Uncharacterized protein n=1 Tax=Stieleria maiorica TaxID=2795974 RepID=A0A5B9M867_9BACT|nr:hypothetical protein Mal15_08930 [Stieleria maiorica]
MSSRSLWIQSDVAIFLLSPNGSVGSTVVCLTTVATREYRLMRIPKTLADHLIRWQSVPTDERQPGIREGTLPFAVLFYCLLVLLWRLI